MEKVSWGNKNIFCGKVTFTRLAGIIFLVILCSIPLVISSKLGIVNLFLHEKIASAILFSDRGHITFYSTYFRYTPGFGLLLIIFSKICAISPETVGYLPIAGLIFIFTIFAFTKKFIKDDFLAGAITITLIFRWVSPNLSGFWTHSFGYILYILFVNIFFYYKSSAKKKIIIVLLILFIGIHLFSYNAELWVISFVIFAITFMLITKITWATKKEISFLFLFFLLLICIFLVNPVIYERYLPRIQTISDNLPNTINYYFSLMFRSSPPQKYLYIPPPSPISLFLSNFTFILMVLIPILCFFIIKIRKLLAHKLSRKLSYKSVILLSFSSVWFVDIISYFSIGGITAFTRYFILASPILAVVSIRFILKRVNITRKARIIKVYATAMCFLSISIFGLTIHHGYYIISPSHYEEAEPSACWFLNHTQNITHIFSDQITQGKYSIVAAKAKRKFNPQNFYTVHSYKYLVDPLHTSMENDFFKGNYVVLNLEMANKRTTAGGWRDLCPLNKYLQNINMNTNLNKIYSDNAINILQYN